MSKETIKISNGLYMDIFKELYYNSISVQFEDLAPNKKLTLLLKKYNDYPKESYIWDSLNRTTRIDPYIINAFIDSLIKHRKDPDYILNLYQSIREFVDENNKMILQNIEI
jgi:hypothetical protein